MDDKMESKNDKYTASIFRLAGEIAFIFGVPVIIAALIGINMDAKNLSGHKYTLIFLAISFVLSWALFIRKYLKITNHPDKGDKGGLN